MLSHPIEKRLAIVCFIVLNTCEKIDWYGKACEKVDHEEGTYVYIIMSGDEERFLIASLKKNEKIGQKGHLQSLSHTATQCKPGRLVN